MVVPPSGWFIMENPIKMDDLEPLFQETSKYGNMMENGTATSSESRQDNQSFLVCYFFLVGFEFVLEGDFNVHS